MLVTLYDQYCVHVYKVLFWNVYKTDIIWINFTLYKNGNGDRNQNQ